MMTMHLSPSHLFQHSCSSCVNSEVATQCAPIFPSIPLSHFSPSSIVLSRAPSVTVWAEKAVRLPAAVGDLPATTVASKEEEVGTEAGGKAADKAEAGF